MCDNQGRSSIPDDGINWLFAAPFILGPAVAAALLLAEWLTGLKIVDNIP